jgi:hypothetical protein
MEGGLSAMMNGQTKICGATTRGGTICKNLTMKNGRCRLHGGKSTGPKNSTKLKGNQNAYGNKANLMTGEFEKIDWYTLTETERDWFRQHYGLKPNEGLDSPLDMEMVREGRMFQRMDKWDEDVHQYFDELMKLEDALTRVQRRIVRMALADARGND